MIAQPERGFRYGSEAMWLASFALASGPARTALDLGTGSGVVALLLAAAGLEVTGIDLRPEWVPYWAETVARSRFRADLRVLDVSEVAGRFDLVVSNPPFFPADTGPVAPDPWKAAARTESGATLPDFVDAALRVLGPGGRACFVVPRARQDEVVHPDGLVAAVEHPDRTRSLVRLVPRG